MQNKGYKLCRVTSGYVTKMWTSKINKTQLSLLDNRVFIRSSATWFDLY